LQQLPTVEVVPAADAAGIAEAFHKLKMRLRVTTTFKTTTVTEVVSVNGRLGASKPHLMCNVNLGASQPRLICKDKLNCKYGAGCTNSSADHHTMYHHLFKTKCVFGAGCTDHAPAHRQQFLHSKS
jgi:hypothetical protein